MQNKLWLMPLAFLAMEAVAEERPIIRVKPQIENGSSRNTVKLKVVPEVHPNSTVRMKRRNAETPFDGIISNVRPYSDVLEEEDDRRKNREFQVGDGQLMLAPTERIPNTTTPRKLFVTDTDVHRARLEKPSDSDIEIGDNVDFPSETNANVPITHTYQGSNTWASLPDVTEYDSLVNGIDPFAQKPEPPKRSDPLILDLDGNGIGLVGPSALHRFDVNGDGFAEVTGWTTRGTNDGFLVYDRPGIGQGPFEVNGKGTGNGRIDNGDELFGLNQRDGDAGNGFKKLITLDTNKDGVFDRKDLPHYALVRVWLDKDANAVSAPQELLTLTELGIASINLAYETASDYFVDAHNNQLKEHSTFRRIARNGRAVDLPIVNVWFGNHIIR